MRSGFLRGARRLWALRGLSRTAPPSEELFAREGPLRAFLDRRAGSGAGGLDAGGNQLAAAARLLSEKERELRDTESLLHGKPPAAEGLGVICGPDLVTSVLISSRRLCRAPLTRCSARQSSEVTQVLGCLPFSPGSLDAQERPSSPCDRLCSPVTLWF